MPETLLRFYQLNTRFKRVLEMPANQVYNLNTSLHLHRGSHMLCMCCCCCGTNWLFNSIYNPVIIIIGNLCIFMMLNGNV